MDATISEGDRVSRVLLGELIASTVRPLRADDAPTVAMLHQQGIPTGFLSSLGPKFLTELYSVLADSQHGFGFVCDLGEAPVGFIACATDTWRFYKEAPRKRGVRLALRLLPHIWRPRALRNTIETVLYPSDLPDGLPAAEILSIVVTAKARRRGIGRALVRRAMAAFRGRDIKQAIVSAWAGNEAAEALYRSFGFDVAHTRKHHGLPMAIYIADTDAITTGRADLTARRPGVPLALA